MIHFYQTVFPPNEIELNNGKIIPKCEDNYLSVYNTEITQCFPGKTERGDRKPNRDEIENCLEKGFLFNEIKFVKPKLLLLMGRLSISTFFKFVLSIEEKRSTNEIIGDIINKSIIPTFDINGQKIGILPIQHASGINPQYSAMLKNMKLINLIEELLNE